MAKPGLYANINAKRKRIEAGSGEKMRKKGAKGAPSEQNFKDAAKTAKKSHGGVHGDQKKLDKNKDGKISGADFKMMKNGGEFLAGNSNRRRSRNGG
jgi:hypothetical protein|tara:strand:- start:256 stop:546 length:291 start_codon:yes stop_codon:yes gene_type:complete